MPKECLIYAIENTLNGRIYVGSTTRPEARLPQHFIDLRNRQSRSLMQPDYDLMGREAFTVHRLLICREEDRFTYEALAIQALGAADGGYNRYRNATPRGIKRPAEAIAKAAATRRGGKHRPETIAKMRAWVRGPEYRAAVSAAQKGKIITPEQRAQISATLTGRKRGPQSPETIAKRVAATRATKLAKAQAQTA